MQALYLLLLLALGASAASAQPFVFYRGILNAASFAPQGLPNGSIARGSIFSIFGRDLGPAEGMTVSSFPLGTTFQGVSIEVCQNANCVQAIPLFVRADQINAIMPSNAPLGKVSVRVTFNGVAGNFSPANVAASSPGFFAINAGGFGPGVVQNFTIEALPINSAASAARPGQTVIAWGTGLGAGLNADNIAPQVGDLPVNVEIWVGDKPVTVKRYSGRSPCCAGVDQIVFDLPADSPLGCYVPVSLRANGTVVGNQVTLAVSAGGQGCVDVPANPGAQALRAGGRIGSVLVHRNQRFSRQLGLEFTQQVELLEAYFSAEPGGPFAYTPLYAQPPEGSCSVHQAGSAEPFTTLLPGLASSTNQLDAGPRLTATVGASAQGAERGLFGRPGYVGELGSVFPPAGLDAPLVGEAPAVMIAGSGGADIGAFEFSLPTATRLNWTNRAAIEVIDRAAGLTVTWAPTDAEQVWVFGGTRDMITNTTVSFWCFAPGSAGRFTVPAYAMANLAPPRARESQATVWLGIAAIDSRSQTEFAAPGLARGFAAAYAPLVKTVRVR